MRQVNGAPILVAAAVLLSVVAREAEACPFCPAPTTTLNEKLVQSDFAALAQFVSSVKPEGDDRGSSVFEFLRIVRNAGDRFEVKQRVTVSRYANGDPGELFLVTGKADDVVLWDAPQAITETAFNYVAQSPSGELPWEKRLSYYMKFLEFPDEQISTDAFSEFAKAPYDAVAAMRNKLPREKLRKWLFEEQAIPLRHGLYGMMLGLCGDESDAAKFKEVITRKDVDFRVGIDGVMGGYMLLKGETALELIEESKFHDPDVPFSELYSALTALRFMWTYGTDAVSKQRLRESMRSLLDRPRLTEIVVTDLSRWKDWGATDELLKLYPDERYSDRYSRRSIVAFLMLCEKAGKADDASDETRKAAAKAKAKLDEIRKDSPEVIRDARRVLELD